MNLLRPWAPGLRFLAVGEPRKWLVHVNFMVAAGIDNFAPRLELGLVLGALPQRISDEVKRALEIILISALTDPQRRISTLVPGTLNEPFHRDPKVA